MKTRIVKIDDVDLQNADIQEAAAVIRSGGLVVMPTETVYGLGGDATSSLSSKKIYEAKGRPSDNPLIIHIAEPSDAEQYAYTNETYYKLAKAFMPGPLTVILPKKEIIPYETTGGLDTVAVRCPSHPVAHALICAAGVPIAAPSANISGRPSATCLKYVVEDFDGKVDMIIDGGPCEIGLESTIVLINSFGGIVLLRPGAITYDALCCVCSDVTVSPTIEGTLNDNEHPISPGMKYKHYAPEAELVLLDGDEDDVVEFIRHEQNLKKCVVLCYDEEVGRLDKNILLPIGAKNDVKKQANMLFARLRECDSIKPDIIYAHLPSNSGLGMALYNRMIRAAAHTVLKIDKNKRV